MTRSLASTLILSASLCACASLFGIHRSSPTTLRSVYGLIEALPTERISRITPLLDSTEGSGGASFDAIGNTVFTANYQGVASAYDLQAEQERWRYINDESLTMLPFYIGAGKAVGVGKALVVEGAQSGQLVALDALSGKKQWTYELGGELRESPVLANGVLLVANSRSQCAAFDPATGKWLWQYARDFPVGMTVLGHSGVAVSGDVAYIGFADGFVSAIRTQDGVAKWTRPLTLKGQGFGDADATPEVFGGRVYAASFEDGVYALAADSGDVLWQLQMPGIQRLAMHDPYLFAASANGELVALDASSGQKIWEVKFPAAEVSKPIVYRGYVILGRHPGGLLVIDEASGEPVQSMQTDVVGEIAIRGDLLAFMSEDSAIYVMRYGVQSMVNMGAKHRFVGL